MLVSFLGSPISGKTTVAAQVFADLKKSGQPNVEFVVEQARVFIAQLKVKYPNSNIILSDDDQREIFLRQRELELTMTQAAGPEGIVISDSCALNALWYMSEGARQWVYREQSDLLIWYKQQLLFKCQPIPTPTSDQLRLHSVQASKNIDNLINDLLCCSAGTVDHPLTILTQDNPIPQLAGPVDLRANDVIRAIYERISNS